MCIYMPAGLLAAAGPVAGGRGKLQKGSHCREDPGRIAGNFLLPAFAAATARVSVLEKSTAERRPIMLRLLFAIIVKQPLIFFH